ncbi:MAG: ester cyclase [Ktedonobacteraceae bacterium]|nr:ester cyclase [Ktedonobacteraceae bacterium]
MEEETTIPQMVDQARAGKLSRRRLAKILSGMGISAAGVGAIITTAGDTHAAMSHSAVNVHEDTQQHLQMHDQHLSSQTQGDVGALHNDYAEHAVVEDSMFAQPIVGRSAIMARKNMGLAAATNAKITVTNRIAIGNQVTVEWVATGTHTGDLPGLAATGRSYTLPGVTVVLREGGKIVREALYYDAAELYRQLRQG